MLVLIKLVEPTEQTRNDCNFRAETYERWEELVGWWLKKINVALVWGVVEE